MDNAGINILCTVIGALIGVYGFLRVTKKDTEDKATSNTRLADRLDSIKTGVDDIRLDIKAQGMKIDSITERLTRTEESVKSAHHRIDGIEGGGNQTKC